MSGAAEIWHAFAPFKVKFHAWLALQNRCWTADRLVRRGLPTHAVCPLCSAAGETMDHLSLQCTFAASVWTGASQQLGFAIPSPSPQSVLSKWWLDAVANLSKADAKVANSFVMLTIRSLWLERNARVFENSPSPASRVIDVVLADWALWISCRRRSGPSGGVG
jgi:hypothetical protein